MLLGVLKKIFYAILYVVCYIFCFVTDITKRFSGKSVYFLCNKCAFS